MSEQAKHVAAAVHFENCVKTAMEVGQTAAEASLTAMKPEAKIFLAQHATAQAQIYATLSAMHATLATIPDPIGDHIPSDWTTE